MSNGVASLSTQPAPVEAAAAVGAVAVGALVVRMHVQRPPVDRRRDAAAAQLLDELIAIDHQPIEPQQDREEMPRMQAIFRRGRQRDLVDGGERLAICSRRARIFSARSS